MKHRLAPTGSRLADRHDEGMPRRVRSQVSRTSTGATRPAIPGARRLRHHRAPAEGDRFDVDVRRSRSDRATVRRRRRHRRPIRLVAVGLALISLIALDPSVGARAAEAKHADMALRPAPANAPNVVIVLLDDVGFGAAETFGGPIPTPTLDRSPSRASATTASTRRASARRPARRCSPAAIPTPSASAPS